MRIFKWLLFALFCLWASLSHAQSLTEFAYLGDEYGGNTYVGLMVKKSRIANPEAPNAEAHSKEAFGGEVNIRSANFDLGGFKYSFSYKLLPDLIFILDNKISGDGAAFDRREESGLTGGVLGWHGFGWNVIAGDRVAVAPGFNLNDYFIAASYLESDSSKQLVSLEPQGWYLAAGPSLFVDVLLTRFLMVQTQFDYSFAYTRPVSLTYGVSDDDYPLPHVWHASAELVSSIGLFAGAEFQQLVNRGAIPGNTRRLDLTFGFKFVL